MKDNTLLIVQFTYLDSNGLFGQDLWHFPVHWELLNYECMDTKTVYLWLAR